MSSEDPRGFLRERPQGGSRGPLQGHLRSGEGSPGGLRLFFSPENDHSSGFVKGNIGVVDKRRVSIVQTIDFLANKKEENIHFKRVLKPLVHCAFFLTFN